MRKDICNFPVVCVWVHTANSVWMTQLPKEKFPSLLFPTPFLLFFFNITWPYNLSPSLYTLSGFIKSPVLPFFYIVFPVCSHHTMKYMNSEFQGKRIAQLFSNCCWFHWITAVSTWPNSGCITSVNIFPLFIWFVCIPNNYLSFKTNEIDRLINRPLRNSAFSPEQFSKSRHLKEKIEAFICFTTLRDRPD